MQSAQVQSEPDSSTFNCSILMSFGLGNDFQMDFSRVTLCTFSAGTDYLCKGARGTKKRTMCSASGAVCSSVRAREAA